MIRVEKLQSCNLCDLEDEFFKRVADKVKGKSTPLQKLQKELKVVRKVKREILEYCINNYRSLIVGGPAELQRIVNYFNRKHWTSYIETNKEFKERLLTLFGYESNFLADETKGVWYSKILNIDTVHLSV